MIGDLLLGTFSKKSISAGPRAGQLAGTPNASTGNAILVLGLDGGTEVRRK